MAFVAPLLAARGAAAQPAQSAAPVPLEVTVIGDSPARPRPSSLDAAEMRALPGAFGDPFRAVEALLGVTPLVSGVPYFYVRGAPPGAVGYFIDGVRVPLLFHIGYGPSVVSPEIVGRVDLYAGGYPAALGRYAGGIVAGEAKPEPSEWHGTATVRLVDAGAVIGGPFDDGRGSVVASGRYSYSGAILSLVSPTTELGYWDYQLRAGYHLTPRDEISVFAFGAHDYLGSKGAPPSYNTTFHRIDLRYDRRLGGPEDQLRVAVTLGSDESDLGPGDFVERSLAVRTEVQKRVSEGALLRAGMDAEIDFLDGRLGPPMSSNNAWFEGLDQLLWSVSSNAGSFSPRTKLVAGVHADAVLRVAPGFEVTPGIRVDDYRDPMSRLGVIPGPAQARLNTRGAVAVDPRLAARLVVHRGIRLVQAYGLASQPPRYVVPVPGLEPGLAGGLQRAFQASVGAEVDLPEATVASVTVFRQLFFNLGDPLANPNGLSADLTSKLADAAFPVQANVDASSVGLELGVHRRLTHHLGGLLSYTLSRSTLTAQVLLGHTYTLPQPKASSFDRTHVANAAMLYDFGRGYQAGIRLLFYTGNVNRTVTVRSNGSYALAPDQRSPPFFRLDLRAEKRWQVSRSVHVAAVLEVQDALFAEETTPPLSCNFSAGQLCAGQTTGTVPLPNAGVEVGF